MVIVIVTVIAIVIESLLLLQVLLLLVSVCSWFDTEHMLSGACFDLLWASWVLDEFCAQPPPEATRPNNGFHRLRTAAVDVCLLWA